VSIALSAVSGGLYEIGDDLTTLGEGADRVALVEDHDLLDMARLGRASVPLDLMSYDTQDLQPSLFLLKETSRQSILTIFNWTEKASSHSLTRELLQLDPNGAYSLSEVMVPASETATLSAKLDVHAPPHSVRIFKIINTKILAEAPHATATVNSSAKAGEPVVFHAVSSEEGNPALKYIWEFGDGVSLEGAIATHTYTHAGVYTAILKDTGFAPESSTQSLTITVTDSIKTKFAPENKRRFVEGQPQ
jgi:hypothetical protein